MNEKVRSLKEQANFLNSLKSDTSFLYDQINSNINTLDYIKEKNQPLKHFKPVKLLRYLIATELSQGTRISENLVNELKASIENRDIPKKYQLNSEIVNSLEKYKRSPKGMYPNWKDHFSILFPFFYSDDNQQKTKEILDSLLQEIIINNNLKGAGKHIVDFFGPQNYGDTRVWGAIIPKEVNVKDAYQIFFSIDKNGIYGGIHKGHNLKDEVHTDEHNFYESWNDYLDATKQMIPSWKKLNFNLSETTMLEIVNTPLNQILYGPPGTGKTYKTREKAVEIANPNFKYSNYSELKEEYNRLVKEGQIKFVTFHQSMGYEDFVEGIKPKMNDDEEGEVRYEILDGIFKNLSNKALKAKNALNAPTETIESIEPFDLAWNQLIESVTEQLANSDTPQLNTLTKKQINVKAITDKGNLLVKHSGADSLEYIVSYNRAKKLFNAFPELEAVKNIDKEFRAVIGGSNSSAYWSVINYLHTWIKENEHDLITENIEETEDEIKNYVLIIDEINRGNVSAIFGELITLLEDTKRLGANEELKVTLPYSKTEFGVPNNVYIIGTMNTADRSVEALDTALRRRFSFTEMMPDAILLSAIQFGAFSLAEILETINQRVAVLLDRDHTIGHSYFMQLQNEDYNGLKEVFVNKIIPLLQEYFYNDYEKIAMVLGEGFVEVATTKVDFAYKLSGHYGSDSNITLKKSGDIAIESAIQKLMNVKPSE